MIQEISLTPPNVCADGVTRDFYKYVFYLIDYSDAGAKLQALVPGISLSYSYQPTSIRLHAMKA
jgi:hypothetical protein